MTSDSAPIGPIDDFDDDLTVAAVPPVTRPAGPPQPGPTGERTSNASIVDSFDDDETDGADVPVALTIDDFADDVTVAAAPVPSSIFRVSEPPPDSMPSPPPVTSSTAPLTAPPPVQRIVPAPPSATTAATTQPVAPPAPARPAPPRSSSTTPSDQPTHGASAPVHSALPGSLATPPSSTTSWSPNTQTLRDKVPDTALDTSPRRPWPLVGAGVFTLVVVVAIVILVVR